MQSAKNWDFVYAGESAPFYDIPYTSNSDEVKKVINPDKIQETLMQLADNWGFVYAGESAPGYVPKDTDIIIMPLKQPISPIDVAKLIDVAKKAIKGVFLRNKFSKS